MRELSNMWIMVLKISIEYEKVLNTYIQTQEINKVDDHVILRITPKFCAYKFLRLLLQPYCLQIFR